MSSTASENTEKFPGWYIDLQVAALQQLPRPGNGKGQIDQATAQSWTRDQASLKHAFSGALLPDTVAVSTESEKVEQQKAVLTNRLKKLSTGKSAVNIIGMPRMKTKDCLKKGITWRDGDLDNWLSGHVPAIGEGSLDPYELTDSNGTTYRQIAESLLETTGSDEQLKKLLKEKGHTFHLEQVADLLRRTKAGEDTCILNNGYANLFFIEDENGGVFGLRARWDDSGWDGVGWHVRVYQFDYSGWWPAGDRFFSRNKV